MSKLTARKWLIIGGVLGFLPIVLEVITDTGTFIDTHFYSSLSDLSSNDPGGNIAWYATISLVSLGSIALALGLTYDWRKKTTSWVYRGSAILLLSGLLITGLLVLWYGFAFKHTYHF